MKKAILFIAILLTACSFNYGITPSKNTTHRTVFDYTGNLIDEWVANRGYVVSQLTVKTWSGNVNGIKLTPLGALPVAPDNYIQPIDGNDCFKWSTVGHSFTGPLSGAFIIRKTTAPTNKAVIFDTSSNTPECQFLLRISTTNTHMGISYNGVVHDCGAAFTYDSNFHQLVYKVDGANNICSVWLDGAKVGSDMPLTGGGLNCNTGQDVVFFRASAGSYFLTASDIKKMRLYNEYIADTTIQNLYTGSFSSNVVDSTPVIYCIIYGQSNVQPPSSDNVIAQYPDSLKNGFPNVQLFNSLSAVNYFAPMPGNTQVFYAGSYPVAIGPDLSFAYELQRKFPGYLLRINQFCKGSTALYDTWNPHITTDLYSTKVKPTSLEAYQLLTRVEQRPIAGVYVLYIQCEQDAQSAVQSAAYYGLLTDMAADFRAAIYPNAVFIISALSSRTTMAYHTVVRQAQEDFVASDTLKNFLLNTDDAARFPFDGLPPLHYKQLGCINIGKDAVTFINP